jgi:hypothetical protein
MVTRVEGRMEKRVRVSIPLELAEMHDAASAESTKTENICSFGVRVITQRPRKPNEQLYVTSSVGGLKMKARVVYSEALRNGKFAVGLQFEKLASRFTEALSSQVGMD